MFRLFGKAKKPENIGEILSQLEKLERRIEGLSEELESLKKDGRFSVQKVGIVRFNPFSGVGGDQSFSVALLDGNNKGVVVTSLFTQEGNRVYGKSVENGVSKYTLSGEEKRAIARAMER